MLSKPGNSSAAFGVDELNRSNLSRFIRTWVWYTEFRAKDKRISTGLIAIEGGIDSRLSRKPFADNLWTGVARPHRDEFFTFLGGWKWVVSRATISANEPKQGGKRWVYGKTKIRSEELLHFSFPTGRVEFSRGGFTLGWRKELIVAQVPWRDQKNLGSF